MGFELQDWLLALDEDSDRQDLDSVRCRVDNPQFEGLENILLQACLVVCEVKLEPFASLFDLKQLAELACLVGYFVGQRVIDRERRAVDDLVA